MKLLNGMAAGLCLTALCILTVPKANAGLENRKTIVTFSGPVEIPGPQILPAGTYVFKVMDSPADRHIVQISNRNETHVFALIIAIPNFRLKATDKTVITFREQPDGRPEALRAWFSPGREWGEHFVYQKSRAVELAKEVNEPVLATPIPLADASVETLSTAPIVAVNPSGDTVDTAVVVEAPPAPVEVAEAPAPVAKAAPARMLPKTASNLPLIGLLGLMTLGAGLGIGLFKRTV